MAVVLTLGAVVSAHADLTVAAGKVEITPSRPVYIAGYGQNRKSTGVHDPLWARCIVLRNGNQTVALVSCDVIGIARFHNQKIRAMIKTVPTERILIGSTHTHSGPDTYGQWGPNVKTSGVDKEWMAEVYRKVAALVDETAAKTQPCLMMIGSVSGIEKASRNARVRQILDTELSAMRLVGKDGKTVATLVNYACHPEVLNNDQLTSDFPHWLRLRVEEKLGGVAVYMNGAQGGMVTADIQKEETYPKGEAWPEAERIGNLLGDKTLEALANAAPADDTAMTFQRSEFTVKMESALFKAFLSSGLLPGELVDGDQLTTEVARFTVGPAEFLTLPGEVLPNIGMFLKRNMSGKTKFLLGLTGDALGYILTPEDFGLKLYEYESRVSVGPTMGRRMEETLLKLIEEGKRGSARAVGP
jgi:hypothetical protein